MWKSDHPTHKIYSIHTFLPCGKNIATNFCYNSICMTYVPGHKRTGNRARTFIYTRLVQLCFIHLFCQEFRSTYNSASRTNIPVYSHKSVHSSFQQSNVSGSMICISNKAHKECFNVFNLHSNLCKGHVYNVQVAAPALWRKRRCTALRKHLKAMTPTMPKNLLT
jgi:hypothetical protein